MALLAKLAGVAAAVCAVALINGGYVYRTQCPSVGDSIETNWTYRIEAIFPYVGYSRSGCEVHTATRLALDAVGVWKIHGGQAAIATKPADHRSEYTSAQRATMQANCTKTRSGSFCTCAMDELARRFTPQELIQVSSVKRFDQLPTNLGQRARDATAAISQGCH